MPSFLSELRRKSKPNIHKSADRPSNNESSSDSSAGPPSNKSSSTINTGADTNASTPASTIPSSRSLTNLHNLVKSTSNSSSNNNNSSGPPPIPAKRPQLQSSASNRYSLMGVGSLNGSTGPSSPARQQAPSSPYAPRIVSVSDNSWVNQKILLIHGYVGEPNQQSFDGTLWSCHHQDSFPATSWPVCDSYFKALVHLQPGPNRFRFDFVSPKLPPPPGAAAHSTWININYLPLVSSPPLDLVILLGRDSPGTYDAVPERIQREGNNLQTAIRKFKMAGYLWQAFTGEQMNRNGLGRRCFRFEEEWQQGTLSGRDFESGTMRNEAKVHIVRTDKTMAELRDVERAQQNPKASKSGELFEIAMEAVRNYFQPRPGQKRYVSVLLLDTHWDPQLKLVRGHAALGGGDGAIQLAVFGSHSLQSWPCCLEEVVPAFTDCTRTDTNYVANDCNESGSNWEAANIGIGAHMHETGHLLGCPHQESGVMLRDYVKLNRTFTTREPFSTRTKSPGQRLCLPQDECTWHRLDCLRFRFHPCFRLPNDAPQSATDDDDSIQVWTVENDNLMITSACGVAWIELLPEGGDVCRSWIEYLDPAAPNGACPKTVTVTESELRNRLPADKQKAKLKLEVFAAGQGKHTIEDVKALGSKASKIKTPNGKPGFKSSKLGFSQLDGSRPQEFCFWNVCDGRKMMTSVRVYHGNALDGVEFLYEDNTSQLFGARGGKPGGSEFPLDCRRGEMILGFYLRSGAWIDAIQILTTFGRKSEVFGNATGGSGHTLIPPRGYNLVGISGTVGGWIDGFGVIISR